MAAALLRQEYSANASTAPVSRATLHLGQPGGSKTIGIRSAGLYSQPGE